MFTESDVREFRALAESRMLDTVRIFRAGESTGVDDDTLQETYGPDVVVYEGPCRVVDNASQESTPNVADADWTLVRYRLDLPVDGSSGIRDGLTAQITSAAFDGELSGQRFRVLAGKAASQQTARRVWLEAIDR